MKSDSIIRLDVENEFRWEPSLDEKGILVKVDNGVVTLQGSVPHFSDRCSAEEVTKRVAGVFAIANDIEVKIPKPGERSDTDIATAAANALPTNPSDRDSHSGWDRCLTAKVVEIPDVRAANLVHDAAGLNGDYHHEKRLYVDACQ
jgi:BON domain-containing protein